MNKKLFRRLCLTFCLFISMNALAEVVTIGSLKYELNGTEAYVSGYVGNPTNVDIPETIESEGNSFRVTQVKSNAFASCNSITHLSSSNMNITLIGNSAFKSCRNLTDVSIACTSIGAYAFQSCGNLQKVILAGVKSIFHEAFTDCSNLQIVKLGEDLERIDYYAFKNCTKMTYIVIPKSCIYHKCHKSYSIWTGVQNDINGHTFYNYIVTDEVGFCPVGHRGDVGSGTYDDVPQYEDVNDAFTGCTSLQSIIYLSSIIDQTQESRCGSNANIYHAGDWGIWSQKKFDYTGNVPSPTFQYNGGIAGFYVESYELPALDVNTGTYSVIVPIVFSNNDMTFNCTRKYTYTIVPIKLNAKVKDAFRIYGEPDPQFSSSYSGFVNGEDESEITSHGTYTPSATAQSDVGIYDIKQSGAKAQNYVFEYEDGTLTVNKAPLTMTANDKTMTYGGKVPSLDARYEGLKNNETVPKWNVEPTLGTTASTESKVGVYPITISNADAKNYELTINNGKMTVEKAELTVRAENKSRLYGDVNPEFTLTYAGLKNDETMPEWEQEPSVVTTATMKSDVGTYPISVESAVAVNYNITPIEGALTVKKAPLEMTPNDATRMYGEENPTFTLSYVGLKNSENSPEWVTEPVIVTSANASSAAGNYAITVEQAEPKNYSLDNISSGTLTITKAPLTISVNNCTRKYGENNPNFDLSYEGLRNGEQAPAWTEMPTIATRATASSDIGEYTITATGGVMRNYETDGIRPGVLTVTPASLLIRAQNASRLYFDSDSKFTYRCEGFANGDNESVLTTQPTLVTTATRTSPVGSYPINIDGAEAKNYTLSYARGELTINKRELTVSTKDYTRAFGEENPVFELKYKGFVNNENESVLLAKPRATTEAEKDTDTGVYDITIGNGVAENYDFNYIGGKLTIEKAYQTLSWTQDLGTVEQYEQVELMAEATSGLDVTYTVEGSPVCSIVKIGKKQYLDCFGEGEAVIVAIQEGNKNWWQTTKIYKPIKIISLAGISEASFQLDEDAKIYDIKGNRLRKLQRGINIIIMGNGTKKKVVVK